MYSTTVAFNVYFECILRHIAKTSGFHNFPSPVISTPAFPLLRIQRPPINAVILQLRSGSAHSRVIGSPLTNGASGSRRTEQLSFMRKTITIGQL